jgi:catechol 2,3-dioxygenase-like lactoylglutathione lyase family enzyme
MSTGFEHVVMNARDPDALATWWAEALGWTRSYEDADEVDIDAPDGDAPLRLAFVPVDPLGLARNRIHLDLASRDHQHQHDQVVRLVHAGATRIEVGPVPWAVLADPEGTPFCVLEPRPAYAAGAVAALVVQSVDPERMAGFWQAATGWQRSDTELVALRSPAGLYLEFYPVEDLPAGLDRLHLDVRPTPGSPQADEVRRLRELGAAPLDIGQGEVPWQVLSDPEGNAFCVLSTPKEQTDG